MKVARLLLLIIVLLVLATAVSAAPGKQEPVKLNRSQFLADSGGTVVQPDDATGPATYIVMLTEPPLARYRGGLDGLQATSPLATGAEKLDAQSEASLAYRDFLAARQDAVIGQAERALDRRLDVRFRYDASINGFAAEMTPEEAATIADLRGVRFVERERIFHPLTDAGPSWIGAPGVWDGTQTGGAPGTYGAGIIVGVIDTGIDPWNPSFADIGGDGYNHTNPFGSGNYVGVCDPSNTGGGGVVAYDASFPCNDKLIGVWGFIDSDANPRDSDGHGSHTASTAAGNFVYSAAIETPTGTFTADVSGVAPHANIIAYDGCSDGGGCPGSSLEAARNQAILDGVDVINYSIGGGQTGDPWNDAEGESWLSVREAGIFAATSAGNSGPGAGTVGAPADLPWITSVGASSHDRSFLNSLTMDDGANGTVVIEGTSLTGPLSTPAQVVLSKDFLTDGNGNPVDPEDARLCGSGGSIENPTNPWSPNTFNGEIVVCERGVYGRVQKGEFLLEAGAGGYILAQPQAEGGDASALVADPHVLPAVHITYSSYQTLLNYLNNAPGTVDGTIAGTTLDRDAANGDIMASFSSRGPNGSLPVRDLLVPRVTAPGRDIWAAYAQGPGGDEDYTFGVISGTSMSSPHVAGAGALLKALHPSWTPAEIESALMTTAVTTVFDDDGVTPATPFAQGAGSVRVSTAAQAGLLLDVTIADFQNADPDLGGDPKQINLASLGNAACKGYCDWTRTLRNPTSTTMSWTATYSGPGTVTVTPASFTLAPGESVTIQVDLDVSGLALDEWHFGQIDLAEGSGLAPDAHLTVSFYAQAPAPSLATDSFLDGQQAPNANMAKSLYIANEGTADLTWSLVEANAPAAAPALVPEAITGIRRVFWDQPVNGSSGVTSDFYLELDTGDYLADDFVPAKDTQLLEIFVQGFTNGPSLADAELISWYIYPNNGGEPVGHPEDGGGSEIWSFSALPTATGVDITSNNIRLDLQAAGATLPNLSAGTTYWLTVFPHIDSEAVGLWYWLQGSPNNSTAQFWNNSSGTPLLQQWLPTTFALYNFGFTGLAFRLTGLEETVCDTPSDIPWVTSISPSSGTVVADARDLVSVIVSTNGLSAGTYEATLCLSSNDAEQPLVEVPITVEVSTTCAGSAAVAESVGIAPDGSHVYLDWQPGNGANQGYEVWRSTSPYFTPGGAGTTELQNGSMTYYTDASQAIIGGAADSFFYAVRSLNCDGSQTAMSAETAVFEFAIQPGTP